VEEKREPRHSRDKKEEKANGGGKASGIFSSGQYRVNIE
jgi:hypothetical protein